MKRVALTGIKPTGTPHLGNYLGVIKPALALAETYRALYFIADYHALTTIKQGAQLRDFSYQVAATWLSLGLDKEGIVFYRQSDIPEIFELAWILNCFTPKGLLNRAHAYKAAIEANEAAENDPDDGINAGLFNYPVLMAADILLFSTNVVPVGFDQKQHVEIARDIAEYFNRVCGEVLTLPEPLIQETAMTIPGLDGRKMSKSYNNIIPIFAPTAELKKLVMRIVTDSRRPEEPKDPESCNVFAIYRHIAPPDRVAERRRQYVEGGLAYGDIKRELFELLDKTFQGPRETYESLLRDPERIERVLSANAEKARGVASPFLEDIRQAVGVGRPGQQD